MTAVTRSKRLLVKEAVSQSKDPGDDNSNLVPARMSKRARRRVILDSDDEREELREQDGKHTLHAPGGASAVLKSQASVEATVPCVSLPPSDKSAEEDEIDASMAVELVAEDEVGDEEFIPCPDDVDEDEATAVEVTTETMGAYSSSQSSSRIFEDALRQVIVSLSDWARSLDLKSMHVSRRPLSFGFWVLLRKVSVDFLVSLYLPAIPYEVQVLFEKDTWSNSDLLSLSHAEDDLRQGIYCDFASVALGTSVCDAYIGSSQSLRFRISAHLKIAKRSVADLPRGIRKSFHYRAICQDGVQANFRKLAAFNLPVELGYLSLLEGIFMILFRTYNYPGYTSKWAPKVTYDVVQEISKSLRIPVLPSLWQGMNASWTLYQGFKNTGNKSQSPCGNPHCDRMTYPKGSLLPEGETTKQGRSHCDSGDPLGPYVCGFCTEYRSRWKQLPDAAALAKVAERLQIGEDRGKDAAMKSGDRPIRFVDGMRPRNACSECKRSRKRCEGRDGQSCTRCVARGIGCRQVEHSDTFVSEQQS
jgi:hypothetical protein